MSTPPLFKSLKNSVFLVGMLFIGTSFALQPLPASDPEEEKASPSIEEIMNSRIPKIQFRGATFSEGTDYIQQVVLRMHNVKLEIQILPETKDTLENIRLTFRFENITVHEIFEQIAQDCSLTLTTTDNGVLFE